MGFKFGNLNDQHYRHTYVKFKLEFGRIRQITKLNLTHCMVYIHSYFSCQYSVLIKLEKKTNKELEVVLISKNYDKHAHLNQWMNPEP